MVAIRLFVTLLLAVALATCEDKTDGSKRPKKDIGLKIQEALAQSGQDSGFNNLGSNLGVAYQQPSYSSSFGYQQPSYASTYNYQLPSTYHLPSYGNSFGYQPQISTSSTPLTYYYKYYKYHYPTVYTPQVYSHYSTPQVYTQTYYDTPSFSNHGLQTDALVQPYSGSYQQSFPDTSFQSSHYGGSPSFSSYQEPLTSSLYSGNNLQDTLSDNSFQQSYQSFPSTSYQTYPASSDYSLNNYNNNLGSSHR